MSRQRIRRMISLLAVIAVAVMIFLFSAQDGEDSSRLSAGITRWVVARVVPGFGDMTAEEQRPILERASFIVRKAAHFSEYALFALTLVIFLRYYRSGWRPPAMAVCAWIGSTLYACTDELHQVFVDSRGPAFGDVCIDSLGAVLGALAGMTLVFIILCRGKRITDM